MFSKCLQSVLLLKVSWLDGTLRVGVPGDLWQVTTAMMEKNL